MLSEVEPTSAAGIPLPEVAGPEHVGRGLKERLGVPGAFPFTRGVRAGMYRSRTWAIRQLAGFATATDTNARYRLLLEGGATGINGVFDYPSLRAFDSDDPRARSDAGRGGVAVDVANDFEELFAGIPLDRVSVSLVSSQPIGAVPHLAMFMRAAQRMGYDRQVLAGTSQNDFLMETAITIAPEALPPAGSFRLECDLAQWCLEFMPRWNPVSISGYNYREAGADAVLEMALALAHGQAVARELLKRGLPAEVLLPRITFFFCAHNDLLEEVAKFRAARRMWARWVRDELGVQDPRSQQLRFHVQTSGVSNTARHAQVNIARSALQGAAAVLGGAQSLHINGYDEALSIPSESAARVALWTQHVLLHETGLTGSADPLGGSYLVEYLTDQLEDRALASLAEIDGMGGVVRATEGGWVHAQLGTKAYEHQLALESGQQLVVGLNHQLDGADIEVEPFVLPTGTLERQAAKLAQTRRDRDAAAVAARLRDVGSACMEGHNVMPSVIAAVDAAATLGEIGLVFRDSLGRWDFPLW
ncbi:MAG TPA: methylmalonyl-CoA mutase family protein [Candidatus Dormibacteraeota bacterium]